MPTLSQDFGFRPLALVLSHYALFACKGIEMYRGFCGHFGLHVSVRRKHVESLEIGCDSLTLIQFAGGDDVDDQEPE